VTGATTVRVEGAKELRATMKRAGSDLADFAAANAEAGSIVVAEAPGWIHSQSGALAGSIRAGKAKTNATIRAGGAKVRYAGVHEWGWPARHIPPRPFLTTAAAVTEPRWTAVYFARLEAIVGKIRGA
jgi:phage gpG-like protein